jgi:hypothetical protein
MAATPAALTAMVASTAAMEPGLRVSRLRGVRVGCIVRSVVKTGALNHVVYLNATPDDLKHPEVIQLVEVIPQPTHCRTASSIAGHGWSLGR